MKKYYLLILTALIAQQTLFAQEGWFEQTSGTIEILCIDGKKLSKKEIGKGNENIEGNRSSKVQRSNRAN